MNGDGINTMPSFGETARGLSHNPLGIIALFIVLVYAFAALVVGVGNMQAGERLPLIWFLVLFPVLVLGIFAWLVSCHHKKLYAPGDYKDETHFIMFGEAPSILKSPGGDAPVTESHLAIIHSSWRYPKKDEEYKRPMYAFHTVIQGTDEVLDRIESVKWSLHPSYPNPIQVMTDRKSRFKLKELAWGESNVRAEVKIKGQDQPIKLNRYINLTLTGPRI